MTNDQIILFGLFGAVFALMLWGRFRYDFIAFGALLAGVLLGVVEDENAFDGFGHHATVIVALVLIVSAGLVRSGAVGVITRTFLDSDRPIGLHISVMGGLGAALSGFMNNVAALALLMPVDIATARKAGRPAGLSLMALSFATILGGMVTLIGTPPNIIVSSIRNSELGEGYSMFDFAPVGLTAAIAGLAFVALIGWRLIPQRSEEGISGPGDLADYLAELVVPEKSDLIGRRLGELEEAADKADVALLGLLRDGERRFGQASGVKLRADDAILLEARPEALDEFRAALGLAFAEAERKERLGAEGEGVELLEVVVTEQSRLNDRTAQSVGLSWRQGTLLLGIAREGARIVRRVRKTAVRPGDILLLLVPKDRAQEVAQWLGCLPLAARGLAVTQNRKSGLSIALFAAAVAAASFGLVSLPIALGLVVGAFVLTRILPLTEVYDHVEWPVVVLLGSMIPLGAALDEAGGTKLIAEGLVDLTAGWPAWAILTVLMVVTMTLSDVLNNTATAIVAAPVGIDMATALNVSPDPFLMAVAVAASSAFLTPIGHKNNTLVLGPGGYRFGDYWRMGLPLEILVVAVSVPAILVFWPL
ncbi:Di-and tricarboxylate transporter [Poseidonocella pacifica]|uniref:Di-and tricarboxylate transporter n=1 Tax=Poseidonocella pacifica TaxID=871651 RepID=A0A1I0X6N3_9RHOB|nr:SLC13 family permease [Poseidonocella pacifica]SFA96581.1 Di-and tricarboxylate transporter [Poseidonocella pacifica]